MQWSEKKLGQLTEWEKWNGQIQGLQEGQAGKVRGT